MRHWRDEVATEAPAAAFFWNSRPLGRCARRMSYAGAELDRATITNDEKLCFTNTTKNPDVTPFAAKMWMRTNSDECTLKRKYCVFTQ